MVEWTAQPLHDLIGYMVLYRNVDSNGTLLNVTVNDASSSSVTLDGLLPASNYSIQVALLLVHYQERPSDPVFVVTDGECNMKYF